MLVVEVVQVARREPGLLLEGAPADIVCPLLLGFPES